MPERRDALDVAHETKCLVVVFPDLVVGVAKPGFGDRKLGKSAVAPGLHQAPCHSLTGAVEKVLRPHGFIGALGIAGIGDEIVYLGNVV